MDLKIDASYIFDTCVFIDALRGDSVYKPRAKWLLFQAKAPRASVGYSVITELELWRGIKGMWTVKQHTRLIASLRRYALPSLIARRAGTIRAKLDVMGTGKEPNSFDCIIAATAEHYRLILVTRNKNDYQMILDKNLARFAMEDYQ